MASVFSPPALWLAFVAMLPLMGMTALYDLRSLRIPNALVIAVVGVFVVTGLLGLPIESFLVRLAAGVAVLGLGFALFSIGAVGGGDAKMAAALTPFVAGPDISLVLALYALVSLVLLGMLRLAMQVMRRRTTGWLAVDQYARPARERVFPMGLIFAITIVVYLAAAATQATP